MKSKKAFMAGLALAASCCVSVLALAAQPSVSAQASKPAAVHPLTSGGPLHPQPLSPALQQKFKAAMTAKAPVKAQAASGKVTVTETQADALKKPGPDAPKAAAAGIVPLFQTLDINQFYLVDNVQTGQQFGFHFNLPKNARVLVQLFDQSAGADMSLALFRDDGLGGDPQLLAYSDNPGSADEYIDGVLPAGDYYWFMVANTANNAQFTFGVAADLNIDAYEPNDSPATAFLLPDALNKVTGNLDNPGDVDYFDFRSVRGQNVAIALNAVRNGTRSQWIFERFDGANWVVVPAGTSLTMAGGSPGYLVKVRVRANPAEAQDPTASYALTLGSSPRLNTHSVSGDRIVRVPVSVAPFATQTGRLLNWSTQWSDSTGVPLAGITPVLRVDNHFYDANFHWVDYKATTDSAGASAATANIGTCNGDYRTLITDSSTGVTYKWDTWFNEGGWRIELDEFPGVGVGGNSVQYVSLGHICYQNIVH
ncbi:hypothetical protein ACW9H6_15405 [Pseudomonas sp. SDO528_S397]